MRQKEIPFVIISYLVKTQMDYVRRALNKDTAIAFKELTAQIEKKAKRCFCYYDQWLASMKKMIVRFRCIQNLISRRIVLPRCIDRWIDLYFQLYQWSLSTDDEKSNNRGDSLLLSLHFDQLPEVYQPGRCI